MLDKNGTRENLGEDVGSILMSGQPDGKEGFVFDVTTDEVVA